jgi:hypothetical protein
MELIQIHRGDIVLMHGAGDNYNPSAYFLTHPTPSVGHKDVVRALYHDTANQAIYTGSEDGVISGWSLASLSERLVVGDKDLDDAEDDKEDEDDDVSEESEIESEESDDGMDVDDDDEGDREKGPRNGPIIGGGPGADRRERKKGRTRPY